MEGARSACSVLGTGLLLVVMSSSAATAQTQTTAFTYQGQLTDAGAPANASYDLRFALFDTVAGGTQIGSPQTVPTVSVSSGVFTVQLDFGVNAFPGANRSLEIGVKPAGVGSFTTLAPRQQISSTPYAIRTPRFLTLIAFVLSNAARAAAGQNNPAYALYELLPSDLATAQSIATQLKLLLLVPGQQDHSVQLFADKVH
jgi:hypothetical protein